MRVLRGFLSLRMKLFLAFFLLSALITLAISYMLFVHMRTSHLDTLKRNLAVIANLTVSKDEDNLIIQMMTTGADKEAANQLAQDFRQRLIRGGLAVTRVYVLQLAPSGTYIDWADSEYQQSGTLEYQATAVPYIGSIPSEIYHPLVVESPNQNLEFLTYAPIKDGSSKTVALVGIVVNGAAVATDVQHFFIQVVKVATLAILVVGMISWWLARGFSLRLSRLHEAMDEMSDGNFDISLPENEQDEVGLLATRLNQLAASLVSEREETLLSAIEALVAALEAKDTYTYGHSSQVSAVAHAIALQIGLVEQDLFSVRIAALLHDIGKIGIPDQVLNKQGRLDDEERQIIEQHPVIGAKILSGIPALNRVTEMVKHHHARWDGNGYPEALAGEMIPFGARIIAVADTYQAMTSDRPYRKGLAPDIAVAELRRCAGSQFDPVIIEAFCRIQGSLSKE